MLNKLLDINNKYGLNKFTLLFPKELESEYDENIIHTSIRSIRVVLFITIILFLIGKVIDMIINPEVVRLQIISLSTIIPFLSLMIGLSYSQIFKKYHQYILSFTFLIIGYGLLGMMIDKSEDYAYALGMMLVYPAGIFLYRIKYLFSTITSIISLILINIILISFSEIQSYHLITYNFFFSSLVLICALGAYTVELNKKRNYILNKLLQEEKSKLEDAYEQQSNELLNVELQSNLLFNHAFDGIFILNDQRYEYVNQSFCDIVGYSFHELTSSEFVFLSLLTDESREKLKDIILNWEHKSNISGKYEVEIISKSGEIKILEASIVVITKNNNKQLLGIMRDVTAKVKALRLLQEQNELRQLLVDISSHFINLSPKEAHSELAHSLEVMAHFVNADRAYIFDYNSTTRICSNTYEYCNEGINPVISELQNTRLSDYFAHSFDNNDIVYIPDVMKISDDYTREVLDAQDIKSLIAIPMMNEGMAIGFVGFDFVREYHLYSETDMQMLRIFSYLLVSITLKIQNDNYLIEAIAKAQESDKLKSAFLANLSHEIRTPMNGILGFLNLLKLPGLEKAELDEYIELIKSSGNRLINTLEDIIEISQIDAGNKEVYLGTIYIDEEIQRIAEVFEQQAHDKGLQYKISVELPENKTKIISDIKKIERIMYHLITNAIKFTDSGSISIGIKESENLLEIYIKDTGIGISPLVIDKVFDRFVQADLSISRSHEGSGLGLSIVSEYTKMLGYEIKIDSELGKGTNIHLYI
ncbi:MAG TPA: ATP-binding protein [Candidatus Kapabacteria bacterium]|nr:ATP-binding protein [Candidatus Kapabacteria bacterium]